MNERSIVKPSYQAQNIVQNTDKTPYFDPKKDESIDKSSGSDNKIDKPNITLNLKLCDLPPKINPENNDDIDQKMHQQIFHTPPTFKEESGSKFVDGRYQNIAPFKDCTHGQESAQGSQPALQQFFQVPVKRKSILAPMVSSPKNRMNAFNIASLPQEKGSPGNLTFQEKILALNSDLQDFISSPKNKNQKPRRGSKRTTGIPINSAKKRTQLKTVPSMEKLKDAPGIQEETFTVQQIKITNDKTNTQGDINCPSKINDNNNQSPTFHIAKSKRHKSTSFSIESNNLSPQNDNQGSKLNKFNSILKLSPVRKIQEKTPGGVTQQPISYGTNSQMKKSKQKIQKKLVRLQQKSHQIEDEDQKTGLLVNNSKKNPVVNESVAFINPKMGQTQSIMHISYRSQIETLAPESKQLQSLVSTPQRSDSKNPLNENPGIEDRTVVRVQQQDTMTDETKEKCDSKSFVLNETHSFRNETDEIDIEKLINPGSHSKMQIMPDLLEKGMDLQENIQPDKIVNSPLTTLNNNSQNMPNTTKYSGTFINTCTNSAVKQYEMIPEIKPILIGRDQQLVNQIQIQIQSQPIQKPLGEQKIQKENSSKSKELFNTVPNISDMNAQFAVKNTSKRNIKNNSVLTTNQSRQLQNSQIESVSRQMQINKQQQQVNFVNIGQTSQKPSSQINEEAAMNQSQSQLVNSKKQQFQRQTRLDQLKKQSQGQSKGNISGLRSTSPIYNRNSTQAPYDGKYVVYNQNNTQLSSYESKNLVNLSPQKIKGKESKFQMHSSRQNINQGTVAMLMSESASRFWQTSKQQFLSCSLDSMVGPKQPKKKQSHLYKVLGPQKNTLTFTQFKKMLLEQGLNFRDDKQGPGSSQQEHLVFKKYKLINQIMGGTSKEAIQLKRKYLKMILSKSIDTKAIMPVIQAQAIHSNYLNAANMVQKQCLQKQPNQHLKNDTMLNPALLRNSVSHISVETIKSVAVDNQQQSSQVPTQKSHRFMYINSQSNIGSNSHSEEKLLNLDRIQSTSIQINEGIESYNNMRRIEQKSLGEAMQNSMPANGYSSSIKEAGDSANFVQRSGRQMESLLESTRFILHNSLSQKNDNYSQGDDGHNKFKQIAQNDNDNSSPRASKMDQSKVILTKMKPLKETIEINGAQVKIQMQDQSSKAKKQSNLPETINNTPYKLFHDDEPNKETQDAPKPGNFEEMPGKQALVLKFNEKQMPDQSRNMVKIDSHKNDTLKLETETDQKIKQDEKSHLLKQMLNVSSSQVLQLSSPQMKEAVVSQKQPDQLKLNDNQNEVQSSEHTESSALPPTYLNSEINKNKKVMTGTNVTNLASPMNVQCVNEINKMLWPHGNTESNNRHGEFQSGGKTAYQAQSTPSNEPIHHSMASHVKINSTEPSSLRVTQHQRMRHARGQQNGENQGHSYQIIGSPEQLQVNIAMTTNIKEENTNEFHANHHDNKNGPGLCEKPTRFGLESSHDPCDTQEQIKLPRISGKYDTRHERKRNQKQNHIQNGNDQGKHIQQNLARFKNVSFQYPMFQQQQQPFDNSTQGVMLHPKDGYNTFLKDVDQNLKSLQSKLSKSNNNQMQDICGNSVSNFRKTHASVASADSTHYGNDLQNLNELQIINLRKITSAYEPPIRVNEESGLASQKAYISHTLNDITSQANSQPGNTIAPLKANLTFIESSGPHSRETDSLLNQIHIQSAQNSRGLVSDSQQNWLNYSRQYMMSQQQTHNGPHNLSNTAPSLANQTIPFDELARTTGRLWKDELNPSTNANFVNRPHFFTSSLNKKGNKDMLVERNGSNPGFAKDLKKFLEKKRTIPKGAKMHRNHGQVAASIVPNPSSMRDLVTDGQFLGNLQRRMRDEAEEMNTCDRVKAMSMSCRFVASGRYGKGPNAYSHVRNDTARRKRDLQRFNNTIREKNLQNALNIRNKLNQTLNSVDLCDLATSKDAVRQQDQKVLPYLKQSNKDQQPSTVVLKIQLKQKTKSSVPLKQKKNQPYHTNIKNSTAIDGQDLQQDDDDSFVDYFREQTQGQDFQNNGMLDQNQGHQLQKNKDQQRYYSTQDGGESFSQFKPTGFSHRVLDSIVSQESKHSKKTHNAQQDVRKTGGEGVLDPQSSPRVPYSKFPTPLGGKEVDDLINCENNNSESLESLEGQNSLQEEDSKNEKQKKPRIKLNKIQTKKGSNQNFPENLFESQAHGEDIQNDNGGKVVHNQRMNVFNLINPADSRQSHQNQRKNNHLNNSITATFSEHPAYTTFANKTISNYESFAVSHLGTPLMNKALQSSLKTPSNMNIQIYADTSSPKDGLEHHNSNLLYLNNTAKLGQSIDNQPITSYHLDPLTSHMYPPYFQASHRNIPQNMSHWSIVGKSMLPKLGSDGSGAHQQQLPGNPRLSKIESNNFKIQPKKVRMKTEAPIALNNNENPNYIHKIKKYQQIQTNTLNKEPQVSANKDLNYTSTQMILNQTQNLVTLPIKKGTKGQYIDRNDANLRCQQYQ